ncbi:MAG: serine/threonine protein kinase, partial [Acidobacteria bacterium]|nr:serine/threonine protein kinase [Acidobacteriota bacterium]
MPIENGANLGRYHVNSLIGSGGMGEVYLAQDIQLGRPVALKVLLEEYTKSKEHLRRFEQEARATSVLNHPNILTIFEIGEIQSRHFIASEFVKGQTLRQITKQRKLKLDEVINIITQVVTGLVVAHSAGIVHRDIKPENIMVREDGIVKILDFGLAKLIDMPVARFGTTEDSTISDIKTNSGAIIGTVSYMSPEQLRGMVVDARTDIWSVGVVLYEVIAGHVPFRENSPADVIVSILEREHPSLSVRAPGCPTRLQQIVARALTKDRDKRYQTAAELLVDIRKLQNKLESENTYRQTLKPADSGAAAHSSHSSEPTSASGQKRISSTSLSDAFSPGNLVRLSQVILPVIILLVSIILSFTVSPISI